MRKLLNGIVEFREKVRPQYAETFKKLALGQRPDTLFIACSDSRVVPNLFASTDPGDVFVVRNVGNIIPPAEECGEISRMDRSEASAVEFAVMVLGVRDIVVCGHSECGACIAIQNGTDGLGPNLREWLRHGDAALGEPHLPLETPPDMAPHNRTSQLNALLQLQHLRTYRVVKEAEAAGKLRLHAWWFDIERAEVLSYDEKMAAFAVIDAERAKETIEKR